MIKLIGNEFLLAWLHGLFFTFGASKVATLKPYALLIKLSTLDCVVLDGQTELDRCTWEYFLAKTDKHFLSSVLTEILYFQTDN